MKRSSGTFAIAGPASLKCLGASRWEPQWSRGWGVAEVEDPEVRDVPALDRRDRLPLVGVVARPAGMAEPDLVRETDEMRHYTAVFSRPYRSRMTRITLP